MRSFTSILPFALLVPAAFAYPSQPASARHVAHEKRAPTSGAWQKRDRVDAKATLPMRIGLKQRNLDRGHDMLMDISNPMSAKYAQHLSPDEVIALFEPAPETVQAVRVWLESAGIESHRIVHSDNKGWLAFDATAEEAENLLKTTYHVYEHKTSGAVSASTEVYHVPEHITDLIDYITPGIKLSKMKQRSADGTMRTRTTRPRPMSSPLPADATGCDQVLTPECIAELYQIPQATKSNPANRLGIFESGDTYDQADLNSFFAEYATNIPQGTGPKVNEIDGAVAPVPASSAGGESLLDFCVAYPIIYPQGTTLFQTDDANQGQKVGFFQDFLDAIDGSYCTYSAFGETGNDPRVDPVYPDTASGGYKGKLQCGVFEPTNVLSASYGLVEFDYPVNYQLRQCNEFMKLSLQGTTVIVASGDSGIAASPGEDTQSGCVGADETVFNPSYISCPYVTNVGATKISSGNTASDPEVASDSFSSGGGFSNIYPIPSWQTSALNTFFSEHTPSYPSYKLNGGGLNNQGSLGSSGTIDANVTKVIGNGVYNRLGRGMPDVAANGENAALFLGGSATQESGTSQSAPIFASIINRINEERLAAGKKTVGFLNPTLYANPQILNDIVSGSNPACSVNGFDAVKGWDPVTGLGTPNYPKMLSLFMSLP